LLKGIDRIARRRYNHYQELSETANRRNKMRGTKEMKEILDSFEKSLKTDYAGYIGKEIKRLDTHGRQVEGWPKDHFYTNSEVNHMFKMFFMGYMAGRLEYMS
jgi:hypothetical protein